MNGVQPPLICTQGQEKAYKNKGSISVVIDPKACTHCEYFHGNYTIKSNYFSMKNEFFPDNPTSGAPFHLIVDQLTFKYNVIS